MTFCTALRLKDCDPHCIVKSIIVVKRMQRCLPLWKCETKCCSTCWHNRMEFWLEMCTALHIFQLYLITYIIMCLPNYHLYHVENNIDDFDNAKITHQYFFSLPFKLFTVVYPSLFRKITRVRKNQREYAQHYVIYL